MIDASTGWFFMPATVKGVVLREEAAGPTVLLAQNQRGEWELPGGWPAAADRSIEDVVRREVLEETGIDVMVGKVVGAELIAPAGDAGPRVLMIACVAAPRGNGDGVEREPTCSPEHMAVGFFPVSSLPDPFPAFYARALEAALTGG